VKDWTIIPFDQACRDASGGNRKVAKADYATSGVFPVVDQGQTRIAGYTDDSGNLFRGHIPVIVFGDHTRCFKFVDFPFAMGADGVKVLEPQEGLEPRYLFHYLQSLRIPSAGYSRHFRFLRRYQVPVPPTTEQEWIAHVLDTANMLRAKRHDALSQLRNVGKSIFVEMFGDPDTNNRGWPVTQLGHAAQFFAGASLPDGCQYDGQPDGFFLTKVSDMNRLGNEHKIETCAMWSKGPGARSATCPPASIIFPKRGGAIGTNKKRITMRPCVLDPNLMAVHPKCDVLRLEYLYEWFQFFDLTRLVSGSSVPQLNKRDLAPVIIPVPPLAVQDEFARRMAAVERMRAHANGQSAHLDALFAFLQDCAFKGEL
jgi:type I restriction enzyme S subunit